VNAIRPAFLQSQQNPATVIVNIDPVAHILAIAVDRNWLVVDGVRNQQRQKLLWKLPRPIIVSASCYNCIRSKRVMCRTDQMLSSCFRSRIWTVRCEWRSLGEVTIRIFLKASHHFVSRNLDKSAYTALACRV